MATVTVSLKMDKQVLVKKWGLFVMLVKVGKLRSLAIITPWRLTNVMLSWRAPLRWRDWRNLRITYHRHHALHRAAD